jgi:hypothetical protein
VYQFRDHPRFAAFSRFAGSSAQKKTSGVHAIVC